MPTAIDTAGLCRRTGERHLEAAVESDLADQLYATGRSEAAMEHLKQAVAIFAEVGGPPGELESEIWKLVGLVTPHRGPSLWKLVLDLPVT